MQRPRGLLMRSPVEDRLGADAWMIDLMKKSMCGTRDAANNRECDWQDMAEAGACNLGSCSQDHQKD